MIVATSFVRRHAAGIRVAGPVSFVRWQRRFDRVTARLRRAWSAWLGRRADVAAFAALDGDALRDLGVARCEIHSFGSEADGVVARTRRRVAARLRPEGGRRPLPE